MVQVKPAELKLTAQPVGLTVKKQDHRPWVEKWQAVVHRLDSLRAMYSGATGRLGNVEMESRVLGFFVECDHLRDWLKGDVAALPVSVADIHAHFEAFHSLEVCNAICNSHKHHTRSSGTTARIRETSLQPDGRGSLTIEIDWANPAATTVDALALAEECVASWREFFAAHGVVAP